MQKHIVIPARLKSTRLPEKPLLLIHGVPLILRVAQQVFNLMQKEPSFSSWQVATDDLQIKNLCEAYDIPVVMTSSDHPSGTDRLAEVAMQKGWNTDDMVVNVQGDEPLVPDRLILQVANLLVLKHDCVMSTLYEPIETLEDFSKSSVVKVVSTPHKEALYFSRSPIPFKRDIASSTALHEYAKRHLGIYAYKVNLLKEFTKWQQTPLEKLESLEQLRILENGKKIAIEQADGQLPPGVDTPEDLERLNQLPASFFPTFTLKKIDNF